MKNPVHPQSNFFIDEDDLPIGAVLSRRQAIKLLSATGGAFLLAACGLTGAEDSGSSDAATSQGICVVRPELTEGPIFVDDQLNRSDVRPDPSNGAVSTGVLLDLSFRVHQIVDNTCAPLANAQVDIWHCDAEGIYSDTDQLGFDTVGQKFLRGYQVTDSAGLVNFQTIYPGWYAGRAVHIHFKIRTEDGYDFTSQVFFDEELNDDVLSQAPYNARGDRLVRNSQDGIFLDSNNQLLLDVTKTEAGYTTTFDVALDMS
ncbi:MAG: intradiol ring-cleavage dioxygenase [Chloroflexota bacterium]